LKEQDKLKKENSDKERDSGGELSGELDKIKYFRN